MPYILILREFLNFEKLDRRKVLDKECLELQPGTWWKLSCADTWLPLRAMHVR